MSVIDDAAGDALTIPDMVMGLLAFNLGHALGIDDLVEHVAEAEVLDGDARSATIDTVNGLVALGEIDEAEGKYFINRRAYDRIVAAALARA